MSLLNSKLSAPQLPSRIKLRSSNLNSIGHTLDGTLTVEFKNGVIYHYKEVPLQHFKKILQSSAPGKEFHSLIKLGGYAFRKEDK